jgi:AraC-like DNA-binding protein
MNIWYYVFIAAAALQGFLLTLILWKVKNNKTALHWLSAILITISSCLVGRIFYDKTLFPSYPKIAIFSDVMLFIYGPLLYWYVRSTFIDEAIQFKKIASHFIIAVLHFFWLSQFLIRSNHDIVNIPFSELEQTVSHLTEIFSWLHISIYLFFSIKIFIKYFKESKNSLSNIPTLDFLSYFFGINILALLFWFVGFVLVYFKSNSISIIFSYNSIWILLTFSVYMISYYAISSHQVFRINIGNNQEIEIINDTALIYESKELKQSKTIPNSLIFDTRTIEFAEKLNLFMESEKPFLDANLTLPILASKLNCSIHFLSKVINDHFQKNFFDFVNEHRVHFFISLLKNPENKQYTLLSLGFESGFNSKSTFNVAFKKVTGKTPTALLKELELN